MPGSELRQARKGATVTADACAGVWLFGPLPFRGNIGNCMSYQVLARKWRPASFDSLVGQGHVLQALRHALDSDRLHHAYLFTGTRGVGKTTIARILARCLNCEKGVSSQPCGECGSCVEISEGRSVDLIEVDAASRTKVEDTRELLDNVQYAPTRCRFKVYLIDEVHMLSGHSFNALLKTLEEPPEHVKFLLATTDPQKLPATVLSRCLQFNLKNMSAERVVDHLKTVLQEERVDFEEPALWQLGRAAAGSMRDALSLTDQAIAFGNGRLADADVASMLGSVDRQHIAGLLGALLEDDVEALLAACAHMAEQAIDFTAAVDEFCSMLHRCAIAQASPKSIDKEFGDADVIAAFASKLTAEDVQLFYDLAQRARASIAMASDPRAAFEMLALRLVAFRPVLPLDPALSADDLVPAIESATNAKEGESPAKKPEPPPAAVTQPSGRADIEWHAVLSELSLSGSAFNVAAHSILDSVQGSSWRLRLDENQASLFNQRHAGIIQAALASWRGHAVELEIQVGSVHAETPSSRRSRLQRERLAKAVLAIQEDPAVQELQREFDAELVESSVEVSEGET